MVYIVGTLYLFMCTGSDSVLKRRDDYRTDISLVFFYGCGCMRERMHDCMCSRLKTSAV